MIQYIGPSSPFELLEPYCFQVTVLLGYIDFMFLQLRNVKFNLVLSF